MLTPYQDRKMKILWLRLRFSQLRTQSKKTVERRKLIFKTNVLVPKTNNMRKEEGATVGVCRPFCLPTFPQRAVRFSR